MIMDSTKYNISFNEELLTLIKEDEFEKMKVILEGSFLYQATDALGATILHYAVDCNNAGLTKYLLDNGCDVNVEDSMGTTPLMITVKKNLQEVMQLLLTAGGDILKLNHEKISALRMLSSQYTMGFKTMQSFLQVLQKKCFSSREIAQKLVDAGCHMYHAALLKDADVIEYMAKLGIPVNYAHPINKVTPMHLAVILDDLESVNVLLKYGAEPNALDAMNENPLFNLYKMYPEHSHNKIEILKILINRGASMTSCTRGGVFHVHYVLIRGNRQAVSILFEAGLDCTAKDDRLHHNVLHYLVRNNNPEVIAELEFHTAKFNVDAQDRIGQTSLLIAVIEGNVKSVEFLLKHGAKTEIKHKTFNTSPLYYAYEHRKPGLEKQYYQCAEMLFEYNADAQSIALNKSRDTVTIFDAALEKNDFNRIKPAVAHLAVHNKLGKPITKMIWSKINSNRLLKNYFHKCQRLLTEKFSGRVVLLDLLTAEEKKMARFLNNNNISRKIRDKKYRCKMLHYRLYYNILCKRYWKGKYYKTMKNKAAGIICKFFQNQINESHLIINKIIDYLDRQSLRYLCQTF